MTQLQCGAISVFHTITFPRLSSHRLQVDWPPVYSFLPAVCYNQSWTKRPIYVKMGVAAVWGDKRLLLLRWEWKTGGATAAAITGDRAIAWASKAATQQATGTGDRDQLQRRELLHITDYCTVYSCVKGELASPSSAEPVIGHLPPPDTCPPPIIPYWLL